jgi:endonuclease/exonuclease/phosphatase family metal-dependent hydrolase
MVLSAVVAPARAQSPGPAGYPCLTPVAGVRWHRVETRDEWCAAVGPPVVVEATGQPTPRRRLMLISWNVHVGGGHLDRLLASLGVDQATRPPDVGVIVLLQEAYRSGSDVPPLAPGARVPKAILPKNRSLEFSALARHIGMSGVYVPSMRNGRGSASDREDRGNAILTTESLSDIRAIELPFGKQRRVAITATIPAGGRSLRVVSMHLDTNSDRQVQAHAMGLELRTLQADWPLIAAGDLNARGGRGDGTYKVLRAHVPVESCGTGRTHWWIRRLDFMFSTLLTHGLRSTCRTWKDKHGSDHRPVILDLDLGGVP